MELRKLTQAEKNFLDQLESGKELNITNFLGTLMIGIDTINIVLENNFGNYNYKYALFIKSIIYSLYHTGGYAIHPDTQNVDPTYVSRVTNFNIESLHLQTIIAKVGEFKTLTAVYIDGQEEVFPLRQFFATLLGFANRTLIEA